MSASQEVKDCPQEVQRQRWAEGEAQSCSGLGVGGLVGAGEVRVGGSMGAVGGRTGGGREAEVVL